MSVTSRVEGENRPLLSARQVGVAAAFGGAALAVVLAETWPARAAEATASA